MEGRFRTDLALEQRELSPGGGHELEGVEAVEETKGGFRVTTIDILDERGSLSLCKPIGRYVTVELDSLLRRRERSFARFQKEKKHAATTLEESL